MVDDIKQWGDPDVVVDYATDGHSDEGERLALAAAEQWARGLVLDVGVGGGRTTGLLAPGARRYVGVDVSPEMLDLARRRHPEAELVLDDARTLQTQPDDRYDLVLFSFNGIDSVGHEDRVTAMRQLARVVRPDGRVLLSSLNLDGVSYDERPLRLRRGGPVALLRQVAVLVRHPRRLTLAVRTFRRTRAGTSEGEGWGVRAMRAHDFRFLVHFATVGHTVALLRSVGLEPVGLWGEQGSVLPLDTQHADADWVQYLCRRV